MTGNTWDIIKIQTKTNQLIMGNRTDQIWVRRRRQRKTKSDNYTEELWKNIGSFINENIHENVKEIMLEHYESDATKSNSCFIIIFFIFSL